ncbi:MAG: response regulator, partial [Nitrososphaera sp.]|nr:response regulator [Nitrososphaera sp.]
MERERQEQILVIEDDQGMVRFLKSLLELDGYHVSAATSGTEALGSLTEGQVDLVVLDLRLPDMSGYELCRKIRQVFYPWVPPVLMLTGLDKPIDQLRGFAFGADAYLTKPCQPEELLKTVDLLLGHPDPEFSSN